MDPEGEPNGRRFLDSLFAFVFEPVFELSTNTVIVIVGITGYSRINIGLRLKSQQ